MINIEITTKCNFDCNYCCSKTYPDEMMTFDKFKSIVDMWIDIEQPIEFNLTGEGEGLRHLDIRRIHKNQLPPPCIIYYQWVCIE